MRLCDSAKELSSTYTHLLYLSHVFKFFFFCLQDSSCGGQASICCAASLHAKKQTNHNNIWEPIILGGANGESSKLENPPSLFRVRLCDSAEELSSTYNQLLYFFCVKDSQQLRALTGTHAFGPKTIYFVPKILMKQPHDCSSY